MKLTARSAMCQSRCVMSMSTGASWTCPLWHGRARRGVTTSHAPMCDQHHAIGNMRAVVSMRTWDMSTRECSWRFTACTWIHANAATVQDASIQCGPERHIRSDAATATNAGAGIVMSAAHRPPVRAATWLALKDQSFACRQDIVCFRAFPLCSQENSRGHWRTPELQRQSQPWEACLRSAPGPHTVSTAVSCKVLQLCHHIAGVPPAKSLRSAHARCWIHVHECTRTRNPSVGAIDGSSEGSAGAPVATV